MIATQTRIRSTSTAVGATPSRRIPSAAINPTIATITSPMTDRPAANLPLITSSRWIGWESSRGSVPWARSPFTASNPNDSPSSGATRPKNPATLGSVASFARIGTGGVNQNSAMKMAWPPLAFDAAERITSAVR